LFSRNIVLALLLLLLIPGCFLLSPPLKASAGRVRQGRLVWRSRRREQRIALLSG
jgi:hypothetical protein